MSVLFALHIVTPFSLGYFLSYAERNVNTVIAEDLSADLALTRQREAC